MENDEEKAPGDSGEEPQPRAQMTGAEDDNEEPEGLDTPAEDSQHYETFTVEFLLNDDNEVRRTRAVHVRSGEEAKWPGQAARELLDFMSHHGAPQMSGETRAYAAAILEHEPTHQPTPGRAKAPRPRVRRLEALPLGATNPQWLLAANQPFTVRATLDIPELVAPGEQSAEAEYVVSVAAKPVDKGSRQEIGEVHGRYGAPAELNVHSNGLRQGLYRLEAAVELGAASREQPPYMPPMENGVIDVA